MMVLVICNMKGQQADSDIISQAVTQSVDPTHCDTERWPRLHCGSRSATQNVGHRAGKQTQRMTAPIILSHPFMLQHGTLAEQAPDSGALPSTSHRLQE